MTPREQLVAYLATLGCLVLIFGMALLASSIVPVIVGKLEAFGLGTICGGLIGVLRMPASQPPRATASTTTGDVNVSAPADSEKDKTV